DQLALRIIGDKGHDIVNQEAAIVGVTCEFQSGAIRARQQMPVPRPAHGVNQGKVIIVKQALEPPAGVKAILTRTTGQQTRNVMAKYAAMMEHTLHARLALLEPIIKARRILQGKAVASEN